MQEIRRIIFPGSLFCFLLFFFILNPRLTFASSSIVINEFLANPVSGQGEWVELYNTTASDVDLTGWILSDKSGSKKKLDSLGKVSPNGFAVYEYSTDGWLNNSASDAKSESISLTDSNGSVIDSYSYYADQKENVTNGRSPDGSDNWVVLAQATKGSANSQPSEVPTPNSNPSPNVNLNSYKISYSNLNTKTNSKS